MTSEWIEATHIMKNRFELCREVWIKKHEDIKRFESRWNNLKLLQESEGWQAPISKIFRFKLFCPCCGRELDEIRSSVKYSRHYIAECVCGYNFAGEYPLFIP